MRNITLLGLFALATLAGCAAPSSDSDSDGAGSPSDTATGTEDVVGITDLAILEKSLGLKLATAQRPGDANALRGGSCYRALISEGPGYPTYEFRRYENGAAFWAKKGSGPNSGDRRPVLCVDVHTPDFGGGAVSLSGVALDAALRYDLGKVTGQDSGMQKTYFSFERGGLLFSNYDVEDKERVASVQKRPHELPFHQASTIGGRLMTVNINDVTVDVMFDGVSKKTVSLSGDVAYFIYRHAWRKAEDTGRFTVSEDAIGTFKKKAAMMGDGPGYAETYEFARGKVSFSRMGEQDNSTTESISFAPLASPQDRVPPAECTRSIPENAAPPFYSCTGL